MSARASAAAHNKYNDGANKDAGAGERDGNGTPATSAASLPCPECGQIFRRREHLSRHLDRHSGLRSHECKICHRAFSRRDTLKRHIRTHGPAALAEWTREDDDQPSRDKRRACEACARGKQACNGVRPAPCSNCTRKSRHCVYQASPGGEESILTAQSEPHWDLSTPFSPIRQAPQSENPQLLLADNVPGTVSDFSARESTQYSLLEQTALGDPIVVPSPLSLEPNLAWDDFFAPAHFLFPFSPVTSDQPETVKDSRYGDDTFAPVGASLDNHDGEHVFGIATATARVGGETHEASWETDDLAAEEEDILIAEHVPHVPTMTAETRTQMIGALQSGLSQQEGQQLRRSFPSQRHLDTYMQLYFEHFHPRMPVLHIPTFRSTPGTWPLALAIVFVGSHYSLSVHKEDHVALLQQLALRMLRKDIREVSKIDILACTQALLLFHQGLWFSGKRNLVIELQFYRNILITLCRQMLSRDGSVLREPAPAGDLNHAWLQWVRAESERRVILFTWLSECLQATLFMLPPLLSIEEMQLSLPVAESLWSSHYEHWKSRQSSESPLTLCALLGHIGVDDVAPTELEQTSKLTMLLSAYVQQAAESDLLRAMRLDSMSLATTHPGLTLRTSTSIFQRAFDRLSLAGCEQSLRETEAGTLPNRFALTSRVLAIFTFTPPRLLYPYTNWQTTNAGHSNAQAELSAIFLHNTSRARHCLYHAAQVFQFFRTTKVTTYLDVMSVLVCVIYTVVYVDLIEQQNSSTTEIQPDVKSSSLGIIRLDQSIETDHLDSWLAMKDHSGPHITGVGLLASGRATARLYKEASKVMASGASVTRMAKEMSVILESQAQGCLPEFRES